MKNRYTDMQDAHDQYLNYEKLIEHINGNERFNAHMRALAHSVIISPSWRN